MKTNWAQYPSIHIITKLQYCVDDMPAWGRTSSPIFWHRFNKLRAQIEDIRNDAEYASDPQLEIMQQNLANLLLQEDSYWRQRSKDFWL